MWLSLLLAPPAPRVSTRQKSSLSATLRRDGFVVIRHAVPRDVCAAVRAELEAELGADDPPGGEDRRVNIPLGCAHLGFDALARAVEALRSFFVDAFGEDGLLQTLGAVSRSLAPAQQIHYDTGEARARAPFLFCNVFLALQDVSREMGPTAFYARSHTPSFTPRPAFEARAGAARRARRRAAPAAPPAPTHSPRAAAAPLLGAGDMVVFDTKTHHHGLENASATRRALLNFSFLSAASDPRDLPGYVQFLATPDVRAGRFRISDFARAHAPPSAPGARAAYWEEVRGDRLRDEGARRARARPRPRALGQQLSDSKKSLHVPSAPPVPPPLRVIYPLPLPAPGPRQRAPSPTQTQPPRPSAPPPKSSARAPNFIASRQSPSRARSSRR